jgi:hypothetical protein
MDKVLTGEWRRNYRRLQRTRAGRIAVWTVRIGFALIMPGVELELQRRAGVFDWYASA